MHPAGSAPPSLPSCSAPAIRSLGLARSDASAEAVAAAGAEVRRGDIGDLEVLRAAAARERRRRPPRVPPRLAFTGDFETAVDSDLRAIEAFGEALAGTDRPLAIASGVAGLEPGTLATERDMGDADSPGPGGTGAQRARGARARRARRPLDRASALPRPSMGTATTASSR